MWYREEAEEEEKRHKCKVPMRDKLTPFLLPSVL